MIEDTPTEWEVDQRRTYTPADEDRPREYATFVHDSGDVRVRVAPASLDGDDRPGYALTVTAYPGLELSESTRVRCVLRFERCLDLATRFMDLFAACYDGPGDFEAALEYATVRVGAPNATDALLDVDRPGDGRGDALDGDGS